MVGVGVAHVSLKMFIVNCVSRSFNWLCFPLLLSSPAGPAGDASAPLAAHPLPLQDSRLL